MRNRLIKRREAGWALMDSLIAVGVFSLGVLGLMALYLYSIRNISEAGYRAEAAFFANLAIARMWADDKKTLADNYAGPNGPKFLVWQAEVQDPRTGLPNATGSNAPAIDVKSGNRVTVTVRWQASGGESHQYLTEARICDDANC